MNLRLLIRSVECKKTDNFFVMVQFEEVMFPSKKVRLDKLRTNICANSSGPRFTKNIFLFQNVGLGNRLTIKLGLFSTGKIDESQPVEELTVVLSKKREIVSIIWRPFLDTHAKIDNVAPRQCQNR